MTTVLFAYHADPKTMPPVPLSTNQIVCGPLCEDRIENGRVASLKTPTGEYDIREVLARIPKDQKPEIFVAKCDATRMNVPQNIAALGIPTVLVLGDTQHMEKPLQFLIQYASNERYDLYVSDHKRHHLHWFEEARIGPLAWTPGLFVRAYKRPFREHRQYPLMFVGQLGALHPWRQSIIDELKSRGFPIKAGGAPPPMASELHGKSQISLNVSLNGDLNLRVFEVMAAGGCLVTDRLAPQAGLELLFDDGLEMLTYAEIDELSDQIRHLLDHPGEALAIARCGHKAFHQKHCPEEKAKALLKMAHTRTGEGIFGLPLEPRGSVFHAPDFPTFRNRVRIYEYFQELHRRNNRQCIHFSGTTNPGIASDLVDLPHHRIHHPAPEADIFRRAGVSGQIETLENAEPPDVTILSVADLGKSPPPSVLSKHIIIEDRFQLDAGTSQRLDDQLAHLRWTAMPTLPGLYQRA